VKLGPWIKLPLKCEVGPLWEKVDLPGVKLGPWIKLPIRCEVGSLGRSWPLWVKLGPWIKLPFGCEVGPLWEKVDLPGVKMGPWSKSSPGYENGPLFTPSLLRVECCLPEGSKFPRCQISPLGKTDP
jgi:hypothetical protein